MKIDFANLQHQYQLYKEEIDANIQAVLNKSNFIMGEEIQVLEKELQAFTGVKHAITCSNGTDALLLAMMAIDIQPGDEVITTPFTFIATGETIALMKARPVFVDIDEVTFNIDPSKIEAAITNKTKAIMPVSLYGQPADMDEINAIAKEYNLKVIIDGAQCFGASYKNTCAANHCDIYTTSFFPAKPLGCYGDGGAVLTNDDEYAKKIKMMRVHGQNKRYYHEYIGIGGRLDTIQAAVLLAKLPHYTKEVEERNRIAQVYNERLRGTVITPQIKADRTSVWAQYAIRVNKRDELKSKLEKKGIPTSIHYPKLLTKQECFGYLGYKNIKFNVADNLVNELLCLPMNAFLNNEQIEKITNEIACAQTF